MEGLLGSRRQKPAKEEPPVRRGYRTSTIGHDNVIETLWTEAEQHDNSFTTATELGLTSDNGCFPKDLGRSTAFADLAASMAKVIVSS